MAGNSQRKIYMNISWNGSLDTIGLGGGTFGILDRKTSRHSIVRGSAVARAQQNLLLTSLRISPLKFGQTSLVEVAHDNQL